MSDLGGGHSCENLWIDSTTTPEFPLWRELPGRWICLGATGDWQSSIDPEGTVEELAARLNREISRSVGTLTSRRTRLLAWCDSCSSVIVTAEASEPPSGLTVLTRSMFGHESDQSWFWLLEATEVDSWRVAAKFASWGDLVSGSGDHRHDSASDGRVRFYRIGPIGPTKSEHIGTWTDVVEAIPYLLRQDAPIPPRCGINDVLRLGVQDGGMSGGAEWPPFQLSESQYEQLRQDLLDRPDSPYLPVAIPDELAPRDADALIEAHPMAAGIVARYSMLSPDTVRAWSAHNNPDIRIGIACRNDLPNDLVNVLISDPHPSVRAIAASRR